MAWISAWWVLLASLNGVLAQITDPAAVTSGFGKPAIIATISLVEFDSLPVDRRELIELAIAVARDSPWLKYLARGATPSDGGFDCSGAMYYVMRKAGLDPPRIAAAQMQWIKNQNRLYEVPADVLSMQHPALGRLKPGDLLFWGKRASAAAGTQEIITHVAMFLGTEKIDKLPVMINSTDGRSYRGTKSNGYGVYDFHLPRTGNKISFIGYGSPPGILAMP